jgi:hypothetical protein
MARSTSSSMVVGCVSGLGATQNLTTVFLFISVSYMDRFELPIRLLEQLGRLLSTIYYYAFCKSRENACGFARLAGKWVPGIPRFRDAIESTLPLVPFDLRAPGDLRQPINLTSA